MTLSGRGMEARRPALGGESGVRFPSGERPHLLLRAQQEIAAILTEGAPPDDCLPRALEAACRSLGWPLAHVWRPTRTGSALRCASGWSARADASRPFWRAARERELPRGAGLPGRAWTSGRPEWVADLAEAPGVAQTAEPRAQGARAALAVPLRVGDACLGVLELFSPRPGDPAEDELDMCVAVGAQVAQFLALVEARWRFEAVAGSVDDAIVMVDGSGQILSWNAGAARIFGLAAAEAIGRPLALLIPEPFGEAPGLGIEELAPPEGGRLLGRTTELAGVRKGGEEFHLELTLSSLPGEEPLYSGIIRDITERKRAEELSARERSQRTLTGEQSALRRVATAVASGADASVIFDLAAREVSELVGADSGAVIQFGERSRFSQVGRWGEMGPPQGEAFAPDGRMPTVTVFRTGRPARAEDLEQIVDDPEAAALVAAGFRGAAAAPVHVGPRLWGAVAMATRGELAADVEERLEQLAYLVALTVGNAEARSQLILRATTDPLTGLANHRTFHERLREEVERARGVGGNLALAIIDLDHFRHVNETHGHQAGDRVLAEAARRLAGLAREGETVARINGGGFAWILPGTDADGAFQVAERARRAIGGMAFSGIGQMTASAGVCDLTQAGSAGELLVQLTDGALYWAKSHGRDVTFRYTPEVVESLSAAERAERLERNQALAGLRALARAIDAKDPSTQAHSERVAELSVRIARATGLSAERLALLREAALVHDVGKIGVPDAVLFKPGRLTPEEYELVKQHAHLGAEIAAEVLTPEQVSWIRAHHERWDGAGYPHGLVGEAIPREACILALADAWDVMTNFRLYKKPVSFDEAMEECQRGAGSQFCPNLVRSLEDLHEAGLDDPSRASQDVV